MIDEIFLIVLNKLREYPSFFVSFLSYIFCVFAIYFITKRFQLIGLSCYVVLCEIIANIQVLYGTEYEILNLKVLLGTVVFSSTYLAYDVINNKYGNKNAINSIYLNLFMNLFFLLSMMLALGHKPLKEYSYVNQALQYVFVPTPRIILSSYIASFISQYTEVWLTKKIGYNFLKHNFTLFVSSIIIDNFVFIMLSMYLLSDNKLLMEDIIQITSSAIIVRLLCNFLNSFTFVVFKKFTKILN